MSLVKIGKFLEFVTGRVGGYDRPMENKKPASWPLEEYVGKMVCVIMRGNRELTGKLAGYDEIGNVVLVDCEETAPLGGDIPEGYVPRKLGKVVLRSPHVSAVNEVPPPEG